MSSAWKTRQPSDFRVCEETLQAAGISQVPLNQLYKPTLVLPGYQALSKYCVCMCFVLSTSTNQRDWNLDIFHQDFIPRFRQVFTEWKISNWLEDSVHSF